MAGIIVCAEIFSDVTEQIAPERVTRPIQLLAAAFVFVIALDGTFLAAAATIERPSWASGLLVVAAIVNVPIALLGVFALQTRFRPQMQEDHYYAEWLLREQEVQAASRKLGTALDEKNLGFLELAAGRSLSDVPTDRARAEIQTLNMQLERALQQDPIDTPSHDAQVALRATLELARGLMAEGQWQTAAGYFDSYVRAADADWEIHYTRGVAHSNARGGVESDIAAVRAYSDAIALRPTDLDPNDLARLLAYRAGTLKRLGRLEEAEADLVTARGFASGEYEADDIHYNLAAGYAMTNRIGQSLAELRQIKSTRYLSAVVAHADDYFSALEDSPEFLALFG